MSITAVQCRRRTSIDFPSRSWLRLTASVHEGRSSTTLSGSRLRVTARSSPGSPQAGVSWHLRRLELPRVLGHHCSTHAPSRSPALYGARRRRRRRCGRVGDNRVGHGSVLVRSGVFDRRGDPDRGGHRGSHPCGGTSRPIAPSAGSPSSAPSSRERAELVSEGRRARVPLTRRRSWRSVEECEADPVRW